MSINKIIVNTTTGQEAADSINEVIDLAEAAATLGPNEFTGDQLVNGNDKQVFAEPSEGRINIAEVTGVASAIENFDQTTSGFRKDEIAGVGFSGNAWFSEVYTDENRVQGSEIFVGGQRTRLLNKSNDGIGNAVLDFVSIPSGGLAGKTQAIFGADRMFIGGPVFTRDLIFIGHDTLPSLNQVALQTLIDGRNALLLRGGFVENEGFKSQLFLNENVINLAAAEDVNISGQNQMVLSGGFVENEGFKSVITLNENVIDLTAAEDVNIGGNIIRLSQGNTLLSVQDGVRLATNIDSETGDAGAFINLQSNGEVIDIFTGNVITINAGNKTEILGNVEFNNLVVLVDYPNLNFADDAAAEAGNVPLGGVYHSNGALRVRVA